MITINKALFILHDELISGPDTALSNVMKEKVTWYSVVRLPSDVILTQHSRKATD